MNFFIKLFSTFGKNTANMTTTAMPFDNSFEMNSHMDDSSKNINHSDESFQDRCAITNLCYENMLSNEGDCFFKGPHEIIEVMHATSSPLELTDFEKLIDSTHQVKQTLKNIQEFENVSHTTSTDKTEENILKLNDINDYFDNPLENDDFNSLNHNNIQNNDDNMNKNASGDIIKECTHSKEIAVDVILENANTLELEPQNIIPLTTDNDTFIELLDNDTCSQNVIDCEFKTQDSNDLIENINEIPNTNEAICNDLEYLPNENVELTEKEPYVIHISSESEVDDEDDNGYNSSDFEFISESEAKRDGYIINFRTKASFSTKTDNSVNNYANSDNKQMNCETSQKIIQENENDNMVDPGEGPSGLQRCVDDFSNDNNRQTHVVPEGDGYLNLFQGPFNPALPLQDIIFLENKSIRTSAMNVQYEGLGFNNDMIRRHRQNNADDKYAEEASETAKKILFLYPVENKRRRRRF